MNLNRKVILQKTDRIEESGGFVWQLILALVVSYVIVYLILVKGSKYLTQNLIYF